MLRNSDYVVQAGWIPQPAISALCIVSYALFTAAYEGESTLRDLPVCLDQKRDLERERLWWSRMRLRVLG